MKKAHHLFGLLLLGAMALFPACDSSGDLSPKEMLTGPSAWLQVVSEVKDLNTGQWVSDPFFQACLRDDRYIFSENGTLTVDEGATKCNAIDPQTTTGSWSLSSDASVLTIDLGTAVPFTVKEISEGKLILESDAQGVRGTFEPE